MFSKPIINFCGDLEVMVSLFVHCSFSIWVTRVSPLWLDRTLCGIENTKMDCTRPKKCFYLIRYNLFLLLIDYSAQCCLVHARLFFCKQYFQAQYLIGLISSWSCLPNTNQYDIRFCHHPIWDANLSNSLFLHGLPENLIAKSHPPSPYQTALPPRPPPLWPRLSQVCWTRRR